jgi:predicted nucleic acid-binding protein
LPARYVVDTSIWIRIWQNHPPDIFDNLWSQLRKTIGNGDIVSPEEVLHELRRGTDGLGDLLNQESGLFLPLEDDIQVGVSLVMAECSDLADAEAERNRADPFVVAVGLMRDVTVVTGESPRKTEAKRRKIPDACDHFRIPRLDWFGFLRDVGWKL